MKYVEIALEKQKLQHLSFTSLVVGRVNVSIVLLYSNKMTETPTTLCNCFT